jgi:hypothetical protein
MSCVSSSHTCLSYMSLICYTLWLFSLSFSCLSCVRFLSSVQPSSRLSSGVRNGVVSTTIRTLPLSLLDCLFVFSPSDFFFWLKIPHSCDGYKRSKRLWIVRNLFLQCVCCLRWPMLPSARSYCPISVTKAFVPERGAHFWSEIAYQRNL